MFWLEALKFSVATGLFSDHIFKLWAFLWITHLSLHCMYLRRISIISAYLQNVGHRTVCHVHQKWAVHCGGNNFNIETIMNCMVMAHESYARYVYILIFASIAYITQTNRNINKFSCFRDRKTERQRNGL